MKRSITFLTLDNIYEVNKIKKEDILTTTDGEKCFKQWDHHSILFTNLHAKLLKRFKSKKVTNNKKIIQNRIIS